MADEKPRRRFMRGITPELRAVARQHRRDMTAAERALWDCLKDRRLEGLRFRAQHPVGQYVLDFFCPICKLVVEVDGPSHEGRGEPDAERTRVLQAFGYHVVRVRNEEIFRDLPGVLRVIADAADRARPDRNRTDVMLNTGGTDDGGFSDGLVH